MTLSTTCSESGTETERGVGCFSGCLVVARPSWSTHVSFEPPPWEELTMSSPSGSATRVSPPGSTKMSAPELTTTEAQIAELSRAEFDTVGELPSSERSSGGFGHTGRH